MLKNNKEMKEPEVIFNYIDDENKSKEEIKKELEKLIKKRNEIFLARGLSIPNENKVPEDTKKDFPRQSR